MKYFLALIVVFLLSSNNFAQEHAPTTEQCRADQRVWDASLSIATNGAFSASIVNVSIDDLIDRGREMLSCSAVDSANARNYTGTAILLFSVTTTRFGLYIQETDQADRFREWEKKRQHAAR